jgi:ribose transport system substrate-binding protein
MRKGLEAEADKLNRAADKSALPRVELIARVAGDGEAGVERQIGQMRELIRLRPDILIVQPTDNAALAGPLREANRAGIPVVILDTRVHPQTLQEAGGKVASFIGSDNLEGGKLAGEFIVKKLGGTGKVAVLEGIPGHETGDSRLKGFHTAVDAHPGMQVVASQTANWERDQGYNVFQNILQSHPHVQALFACSDLMALGAVEAIAAAGKTGKISVVGFDAFLEAREAVLKGTMDATIAQSPSEMGRLAIENAALLLRGGQVPEEVSVKIELVTKENAAEKK